LNNIDTSSGLNSKTLLDACVNLKRYKLNNVDWTINDNSEINQEVTPPKIKVLERLLDIVPVTGADGNNLPTSVALTGKLSITEQGYNKNDSFDIYNLYAQEDVYPMLDVDFEGSVAKLHLVTILDGNNNINWNRRIVNNNKVTEDFLSDGPYGAFDLTKIYRSPTASHTYTFEGEWEVWINNEKVGSIYNSDFNSYGNIVTDITFKPVFVEEDRYYTISVLDGDGTNLLEPTLFKYAATLSEIKEKITAVPYKDDSQLSGLTETYAFKGYGLLPTSTTPITENYIVTND
jgi:hypothetical protein